MMRFVKNASAILALMAAIGSASAIPVTDIVDPNPDVTISVGNPYTFTHDITDGANGYLAGFDTLISAFLTINVIDNVNRGNEIFRFAIGSGDAVQVYDGDNINNGNTASAIPIVLLAALADLSADGILSVTLSASEGDYRFIRSELSADITGGESNLTPAAVAAVPEPGSLALLGMGIVGLSLMRKRKN